MQRIWMRVWIRPLLLLGLGLLAYLFAAVLVPIELSEVAMLSEVVTLSENVAPIVFVAFLLWATGALMYRYWQVKRWQVGRANGCGRCGGPTIAKWVDHSVYAYCLHCERTTRI
jgi:hypothetical protein